MDDTKNTHMNAHRAHKYTSVNANTMLNEWMSADKLPVYMSQSVRIACCFFPTSTTQFGKITPTSYTVASLWEWRELSQMTVRQAGHHDAGHDV